MVEDPAGREAPDTVDEIPAEPLSAEDEPLPGQKSAVVRREQRVQVRRRDLEHVERGALEPTSERRRVDRDLRPDERQRPARAQRREEGRVAEVGRDRGDHPEDIRLPFRPQPPDDVADVVGQVPVRDRHALRRARRARRVDDVGEIVGAADRLGRARVEGVELAPVAVEAHHVGEVGEPAEQRLLRHERARARFRRLMREPGDGVLLVEGQVRAAGLENPENADGHLDRPVRAERDDVARADAGPAQPAGELVRAGIEVRVGDRLDAVGDGERVGRLGGAKREQLMRTSVGRLGGGLVDRADQELHVIVAEQLELADRRILGSRPRSAAAARIAPRASLRARG